MYCLKKCNKLFNYIFNKIPKNLDYIKLNYFYPPIKKGRVIRVYDGDTITIAAKVPLLRNKEIYKFSIRLNRIDCPEIITTNTDEKICGLRIRDLLSEKIMNKIVNIEILKTDKYGRYLAEVSYKKENISDWLLDNKYATLYNGAKKEEFNMGKYNNLLLEDTYVKANFVNIPLNDGVFNC
jgi:micrococcal nuclease